AIFESYFTPCVEIGWRLDNKYWNKGYATEGAKACLKYGFNIIGLNDIYSFTSQLNEPSINVMKKIGLIEQGTFNHPKVEKDNHLRTHVLYKIDKARYDKS
ncbi:GNAT family N-acetyltransferase, partial [Vallitalea maricola]|uniref:GNAT family N-acetyltransferase n=1 Tax=Vallitalea maricola TaxID=3074433 RepID=UPI0030DAB1E1